MSNIREQIKGKVEELEGDAICLLQEMVHINSENPPGNSPELAHFLTDKLQGWGMIVEALNPPDELLKKLGLPGPRPSVLAKLKESGAPTLILSSHLDTLPVGDVDLWEDDPFSGKIRDGRIWGRGAMDSKGRITAYVIAMRAIKEVAPDFRGNIILAATADEEIGGETGTGYLVKEGILTGDYCIAEAMCEAIYHAFNGIVHLEVSTKGRSFHAAHPSKGVNAIYKMAPMITAIEKYNKRLERRGCSVKGIKYPTCNLGTIKGGVKVNVVPDQCVITIDRRVTPDEKLDDVLEELRQLLEKTSPRTYKTRTMIASKPMNLDPKSSLIRILNNNVKEITGKTLPVIGAAGFSDSRFFANELGIQTVNFGPGRIVEGKGHSPNENVRIADLTLVAKACALTALDLPPQGAK